MCQIDVGLSDALFLFLEPCRLELTVTLKHFYVCMETVMKMTRVVTTENEAAISNKKKVKYMDPLSKLRCFSSCEIKLLSHTNSP